MYFNVELCYPINKLVIADIKNRLVPRIQDLHRKLPIRGAWIRGQSNDGFTVEYQGGENRAWRDMNDVVAQPDFAFAARVPEPLRA